MNALVNVNANAILCVCVCEYQQSGILKLDYLTCCFTCILHWHFWRSTSRLYCWYIVNDIVCRIECTAMLFMPSFIIQKESDKGEFTSYIV